MAQAPAPKVTITGFIDEVGTYGKNLSDYDNNYSRQKDTQATGRTRGRFDIIGEVGKAKAVLGIELDAFYGQTGNNDTFLDTRSSLTGGIVGGGRQGAGANAGFDLNTDTIGMVEIKWLYTEFPMPIPLPNTLRLGAQPFGTVATDKLALYANGDFPGVVANLEFAPGATLNLAYVQVEEQLTGFKDGWVRGEDWAVIASFGFSPFKGLDVKPMYSFFQAQGATSGSARQGRGGVDAIAAFTGSAGAIPGAVAGAAGRGVIENRHTIGVDGKFTAGPFSLQPSVLYQFGQRHNIISAAPAGFGTFAPYGVVGSLQKADISAWLVDVRGAFNVGPLMLAAMGMWTSGDTAKSNPFKTIGYFQPLDTDTSYLADWGTQILSLGIDYFHILYNNAAGLNPGVAIGYDKYGRAQVGGKVAYAVTPTFTVGAGVTTAWTDKKVDTNSLLTATGGLAPLEILNASGRPNGNSRYLGTEINLSTTYRFAPGIAWDIAGGYLFSGEAMSHALTAGCCGSTSGTGAAPSASGVPSGVTNSGIFGRGGKDGVNDVIIATTRLRFSF
jgi:hypothetical protein